MAAYIPVPRDLTRVKTKSVLQSDETAVTLLWCGGAHRSADFLSGQSNRKCEPCSTVHDDRHVTVVLSGNV